MFCRIATLLLVLGSVNTPLQAGWFDNVSNYFSKPAVAAPATMKILVLHDQPGTVLEVKGKYKLYDPHTNDFISTRFIGKRKYMQAISDGLKWGEEFPGVHQLMILPDSKEATTVVNGIEYHGPIYVYDIGGTISVVNTIYVEDYLSSILAPRYRQTKPEEFLAAVAITARTSAYYRFANPKNQYWSVDASQVGYLGYASINPTSAIEKAISSSRYMVMNKTSENDGKMSCFPAVWKDEAVADEKQAVVSQITLAEAEEMANNGSHAAQILAKAFPGTKIELIQR